MKINRYVLIILTFFALSCSNNEEVAGGGVGLFPQVDNVIERFEPISIKFIHEDGTTIQADECLSSEEVYAVQIEAKENSAGNTEISKIEYTINGATFSMSFTTAGTKSNPIVFVNGKNSVELVKTAESKEVFFVQQDAFELVE